MNQESRPNPDELLKAIQKEEQAQKNGQLKIFLGMAAGVGKTYAMLKEAQAIKKEGRELVIGFVDTHGRQETACLMEGLKVIPEKTVVYKEKEFKELDLDAIIQLKPELVLVDELAHSNVPGLRHSKRWQDVFEILDNGIDVYTTLNVQHIESLNDIIKRITGVSVRETVPDLIIEKATSIQLVDLTPDELLDRLKEGKVYLPEQSHLAIQNFFKKDRLSALREIALRYTAEKVDRDLRVSASKGEQVIEWKTREKLLVAVSHSPFSQKLIRITRRWAAQLDAPWIAVYVNDGQALDEKDSNQLAANLLLARDLGAEVVTINDPNIAEGIKRTAYQRGVTQILLGRAPKRSFFNLFRSHPLLDTLVTECKDIDIHVIRQEKFIAAYHKKKFAFSFKESLISYLYVFVSVLLLTAFSWLITPFIGYKVVGVIFLLAILALSLFFKKGPIFFAAILYAFIWSFLFIPPAGRPVISSNEDSALLVLYIFTAMAIGILADKAREHTEMLIKGEESTRALYEITRQIAIAPSTPLLLKSVTDRLAKLFKGVFEILLPEADGTRLAINPADNLLTNASEKNAAVWAFENAKEAGWSTETMPSLQNLYMPLKGFHTIVGLLIYKSTVNKMLTAEEKNFLYHVCQQLAGYLERTFAEEKSKQHEQLKQIEKIHKTILDRFAHAFELPIGMTRRAIKELKNQLAKLDPPLGMSELHSIEASVEVFVKILANIAAMARLSEGLVPLKKEKHDIKELIEECCKNSKKSHNAHTITIKIEEHLPFVYIDYYLVQILLYNLILNALEYSPPATYIEIEAKTVQSFLVLSISDEGKGIPEDQLDVIFEKFYRLPDETSPGIGLGLAIAKTIAEIHQGYLKAENLPTKGAKFSLFLPLEIP